MDHKSLGVVSHFHPINRLRCGPMHTQYFPAFLQAFKTGQGHLVPGDKQGTVLIALLEQHQTVVKLGNTLSNLLRMGLRLHQAGQSPGLHTQSPRLVHSCGSPIELPRHPHRQANGQQGQDQ